MLKISKTDFQSLVDFAQKHSSLTGFLERASSSVYTALTIQPPLPSDLKVTGADGLPSAEWTAWMSKNAKTVSLNKMTEVLNTLREAPKGSLTLTNPADNPLQYDRRFLQIHFEGNDITQVIPRSL